MKKTNYDYWEELNPEKRPKEIELDVWDTIDHLEELKKNPPKSKLGKRKLKHYKDKFELYEKG